MLEAITSDPFAPVIFICVLGLGFSLAAPVLGLSKLQGTLGKSPVE